MPQTDSTPRSILRAVLIVVAVVLALYVIYLLRKPISWLVIAAFIAIAAAGPVNFLQRRMKRGFAIALVYVGIVLAPFALGALLVPPLVSEVERLAQDAPAYADDVREFVEKNETLANLNDDYNITTKLEEEAEKLPSKVGDAAGVLQDIGFGVVNSIFAAVTILILSIFMVGGGPRWIDSFVEAQNPKNAERIERTLRRIANAIGNYVGGALLQATIAGVVAFIVLSILGAPFAGPLAVLIFAFDLIPVVGATIGAVIVGIVMAFVNFPVGLIVWVVYAIVFQQIENYVIQPQIQKRATQIEPFVILVAVLFGSTLFGVIGAILAIPTAASIQIAISEWRQYRKDLAAEAEAAKPKRKTTGKRGSGGAKRAPKKPPKPKPAT